MIFWISSYPKSGNTWVRAFLANYISNNSKNVFEKIQSIKSFPSKEYFENIVSEHDIKKNYTELFKHFIPAQKKINSNNKFNILKTHNFGGSIKNSHFTDNHNSCGAVYIVRDPRSIAVSYAYYANISFEKSTKLLLDKNRISFNQKYYPEARLSWDIHVVSWFNNFLPKLFIRYEDLHENPIEHFKSILTFLNKFIKIEIDEKKIGKIKDICSFDNLSKLENKIGFSEKTKKISFFRKGKTDEWKTELTPKLIKKIEDSFKKQMKELGYL